MKIRINRFIINNIEIGQGGVEEGAVDSLIIILTCNMMMYNEL